MSVSKHRSWQEYDAAMPESKLELIDGRLVVGNSWQGSRYMLQDLLDGWGAGAALPFAPAALWFEALHQGFLALEPPQADRPLPVWRAWASQVAYSARVSPAGPHVDGGHYVARERLSMELYRITEAGHFGRSLGRDCVVRLGDNAFTPDVFLIGADQADSAFNYYFDGPPCLAIEVLLRGHEAQDRAVKRRYYASGRIPEYWLIDAAARAVELLRLKGGTYQQQAADADGRYRPVSIPGLAFAPQRLWEDTGHPNHYPELFVIESPGPTAKMTRPQEGIGWGHLPFEPRPGLEPQYLRFEEFISWCGRAKFERVDDKPLIGGTLGSRNLLGMLLRCFGLVEAVGLLHPKQWVNALAEADEARRSDASRKTKWWSLARRAAAFLRERHGMGRLAVIGDLVRAEPLNCWSDLTLVVWGLAKGIPWEVHESLFALSREPGIELIRAESATAAEQRAIAEEAVEI
jgi:hypothetical protein